MPTVMSHAVVGVALGTLTSVPFRRRAFWTLAAVLPVLPDLDVLGRAFGVPFSSPWGHRGLSHSLVGAVVVGVLAALLAHRRLALPFARLAVYFVAITASHGILDALTDGGPGIAFLAPFDNTRYFFPWRPIPVSPLAAHFFSEWGWRVFKLELLLIWLPAGLVALVARGRGRR